MGSASTSPGLLSFTDRGSGPPLLLVHGLMVSGEMFAPVIGRFAARHRVIVPDLRGHGRSRHLPPPYTTRQLAADLSRLLDHLGIRATAVLGYSQGGGRPAAGPRRPDALRFPHPRLHVCLQHVHAARENRRAWPAHPRPGPGYETPGEVSRLAGAKELSKDRADWLTGLMADQDRTLMVAAWRETMAFDSRHRLAEIACPTLVVAGAIDRGVPMHHALMLRDGIRRSQLVVDGAGHTLMWTHHDELVRLTDQFLGAQARGGDGANPAGPAPRPHDR